MVKFKSLLTFTLFFCTSFYGYAETLRVHFIHVGYGDCILIENQQDKEPRTILIDTGKKKYRKKVLKYLKTRNLLPLDWVIITHPHPDHYGALPYLIEKTDIKHIYWNGHTSPEKDFQEILNIISQSGIPLSVLKRDDMLAVGKNRELLCLHPENADGSYNDASLVLLLKFSDTTYLFTADIGAGVQDELMRLYPDIIPSIQVLKLPHHGDTMSDSFATTVQNVPYPVLTIGKNKYKFPRVETLKIFGKRLLRTDYCIDIVLESNGTEVYRIQPKKK